MFGCGSFKQGKSTLYYVRLFVVFVVVVGGGGGGGGGGSFYTFFNSKRFSTNKVKHLNVNM